MKVKGLIIILHLLSFTLLWSAEHHIPESSIICANINMEDTNIEAEGRYFVSSQSLNLRKEPTLKAKKVQLLSKGTKLIKTGEELKNSDFTWVPVRYHEQDTTYNGWVARDFLVTSKIELIDKKFNHLDFSAQEKSCEFQKNPRVKTRGIYLTMYSAMSERINNYVKLAHETNINTFVIDIKNIEGRIFFRNKASAKYAPKANNRAIYRDIGSIIEKLKKHNIYVIGRVVAFKDDYYASLHPEHSIVMKDTGDYFFDRDKLRWVSPYNRHYWNYLTELSVEAAKIGFNEIQIDYIRFPELVRGLDLRNENGETKAEAIQKFLIHVRNELEKQQVYLSADVFGLITTEVNDLNLGQYYEAISTAVHYISPMMYPSHYAAGFYGIKIPDASPFKTIYYASRDAVIRNQNIPSPATIRPWIQDFTAFWVDGHISYSFEELKSQIEALKKNGIEEYLIWNPKNRYKNLQPVEITKNKPLSTE